MAQQWLERCQDRLLVLEHNQLIPITELQDTLLQLTIRLQINIYLLLVGTLFGLLAQQRLVVVL